MKKGVMILAAAATLGLSAQANAGDAPALAQSKNCLTCRMVDKKVVGPGLKEIAQKYKGDSDLGCDPDAAESGNARRSEDAGGVDSLALRASRKHSGKPAVCRLFCCACPATQ